MNYEAFRSTWQHHLRASGMPRWGFDQERLDLRNLTRTYSSSVSPIGAPRAEPFLVTASLSWRWDAVHEARTATTEEDLLLQVFGQGGDKRRTERPWLRIDIELRASLPWGNPLPMPAPAVLSEWFVELTTRLESIEPVVREARVRTPPGKDKRPEYVAWSGEPSVEPVCNPDGTFDLAAVGHSAWDGVHLPRVWSDSSKREDPHPGDELDAVFKRVRLALFAFAELTDHLRPRSQPPRASKRAR